MSKTNIKNTSVPPAYDPPMTTLEYLRKVESQNAQVLARADEIEEALDGKVAKEGDTMTGALNVPQVNADTGVFHDMNVVSQDEKTHVEADNNGFVAEVSVPDLNKKFTFGVGSNGKVALNVHDVPNNRDTLFIFPNADDYEAGTHELATKDDIPSGGSSLLEDIEDEDGHKWFQSIAGNIIPSASKFEMTYARTAINGHSVSLVAFVKKSGSITLGNTILAEFALPTWVLNKIVADENTGIVLRSKWIGWTSDGTISEKDMLIKKVTANSKLQMNIQGDFDGAVKFIRCEVSLTID